MQFTQLNDDYKYDVLAEQMYAREVEWFHYDLDVKNFQRMLDSNDPGINREYFQQRIAETQSQMAIVESVYNALKVQITDADKYSAACARAAQKRANATA